MTKALEWLFRSMQDKHGLRVHAELIPSGRSVSLEMQELVVNCGVTRRC